MKKKDIKEFVTLLKNRYPDATCSLDFKQPFELVIAVMLSAQCTDARVNMITPKLFQRCKTIQDVQKIDITELESIIHPCGFYKNKAKNIKLCANQIIDNFDGEVPQIMEELITLAGIGRKSANVILLEVFGKAEGIAVDTHVKRISRLVGLSKEKEPEKIEQDLLKLFPKKYLADMNHLLVWHGRNTCIARKPKCDECVVNHLCKTYLKSS